VCECKRILGRNDGATNLDTLRGLNTLDSLDMARLDFDVVHRLSKRVHAFERREHTARHVCPEYMGPYARWEQGKKR